jgi:hypothetical protein
MRRVPGKLTWWYGTVGGADAAVKLQGEGETGTGRETGLGQKVRPGPVERLAWARR